MSNTSAVNTPANDFQTNGMSTLTSGMATKSKLSASFSFAAQSRARRLGTVNIHTLHIPINLAIDGSSDGQMTLYAKSPPTTMAKYACTSNTVYKTLPLYAGFFFAVLDLGANVVAVFFANLLKFRSKSASEIPVVVVAAAVVDSSSSVVALVHTNRIILLSVVVVVTPLTIFFVVGPLASLPFTADRTCPLVVGVIVVTVIIAIVGTRASSSAFCCAVGVVRVRTFSVRETKTHILFIQDRFVILVLLFFCVSCCVGWMLDASV